MPDPNLYIWNLEKDNLGYFDFEKGVNDIDEVAVTSEDDKTAYEKWAIFKIKKIKFLFLTTQIFWSC